MTRPGPRPTTRPSRSPEGRWNVSRRPDLEEPTTTDVVILGGGLAGVACARAPGQEGVSVTLVDRNDYNQFQPLLYQVATSQLPAEDVARPLSAIFADLPTVGVVVADVESEGAAMRSPQELNAMSDRQSGRCRSRLGWLRARDRHPGICG
jgi:NADPH-dependent 2,4-dienoyl-CoA reductase/sulfur reductase-like enzyme